MAGKRTLDTDGGDSALADSQLSEPERGRAALALRLFGPMDARLGGEPLPHLRSRKGLWLLALLALRGGRPIERDWLAGTLWPECDEIHGRRSLRQTLHDLRTALGSESWRLASDEPKSLCLNLAGITVDVLAFDAALERGDAVSLEAAAGLYRGPLLEDCAQEWAVEDRRAREQAALLALENLAADAAAKGQYGDAAVRLRAALRIDPYRESLLRSLMEALAADGNTAAALVAYREFRAMLGRELIGEPAEETAALFRRLRHALRAAARPEGGTPANSAGSRDRSAELRRRTLPIPLTPLIGRDQDVRKVVSLAESARLITLTGSGGVGKTRLVIEVAGQLAARFGDGAVFVDLAPIRDPENLPDAVRIACGAAPQESRQNPFELLCDHLVDRLTLLVLDNCEQLDRACGDFASRLLGRCPSLKILATSRQVLGVKGETVWRVPSLAIPGAVTGKAIAPRSIGRVASYLDFAAIRLFADRAVAAESTFEVSRRNLVPIAMICSRLDGIPLAIELAAARVKSMTVERIAERLNDRFRILLTQTQAPTDAAISRHLTLRASIDWSCDLLSPSERTLLNRLAAFVGGWTLEAAETVCAGGAIQEWEVLELLSTLVEKSLVVYNPGEDRYRLLETIRQYLLACLEDDGEGALRNRHLDYFVALAEAAKPELIGPNQVVWFDRLEADHDNVRAALSWSRIDAVRVDKGFRLVGAIWRFWQLRGFVAEGRAQIAQSVSASAEPTAGRASALNVAGILAYRQSDYPAARSFYEESLQIRRKLGNQSGIASALHNLANVAKEQGDYAVARGLYEESLAIYREMEDRWCIATCLLNLGKLHYDLGDNDTASQLFNESLAIHRDLGDPTSVAYSLSRLGSIADQRREYDSARSLHEESLAIRRSLGDRPSVAASLYDLGLSTRGLGNHHAARSLQADSLQIQRELGNRAGIVQSLEAFADLALEEHGDPTHPHAQMQALLLLGAAEALREAIGFPVAPNECQDYCRQVDQARQGLDEDVFTTAWAQGRAMPLEQAIDLALRG